MASSRIHRPNESFQSCIFCFQMTHSILHGIIRPKTPASSLHGGLNYKQEPTTVQCLLLYISPFAHSWLGSRLLTEYTLVPIFPTLTYHICKRRPRSLLYALFWSIVPKGPLTLIPSPPCVSFPSHIILWVRGRKTVRLSTWVLQTRSPPNNITEHQHVFLPTDISLREILLKS